MAADEVTGAMAGEPGWPHASSSSAIPGLVLAYAPSDDANNNNNNNKETSVPPSLVLLERGSTVFGREPPPHGVKLALTSVSRVHARVDCKGEDNRCSIHDLGSRNGIFVRGVQVDSAELNDGDDIRIGDAMFVFVADSTPHQSSGASSSASRAYPYPAIACGPATRRIFDELEPIAASTMPVLVLGETGTGKELVAEAIHAISRRPGALRALNCAAIPATLVESELFGFKKGAFSGADRDRVGIVGAAHRGTLFLDEIGDMPLEIQPKLLRLLESSEISPVGSANTERVDVRIVCATHADLAELVETKRFRADLYSRIRGYVVTLPALRQRKQDIQLLVRALLERLERRDADVSVAFMVALLRYDWPFNVRELFTVLRRAVTLAGPTETLDTKHLPSELLGARTSSTRTPVANPSPSPSSPDLERGGGGGGGGAEDKPPIPSVDELRNALKAHDGNVAALSRVFRRDRSLIHRWLKQHGIEPKDYRDRES